MPVANVVITGLYTPPPPEDRVLISFTFDLNSNVYNWQSYVPVANTGNLSAYIDANKGRLETVVLRREGEWANLNPKYREVQMPDGSIANVPIQKEEIVRAKIPDNYAIRRERYPSFGDQLDAIWKYIIAGASDEDYLKIRQLIIKVKQDLPLNDN